MRSSSDSMTLARAGAAGASQVPRRFVATRGSPRSQSPNGRLAAAVRRRTLMARPRSRERDGSDDRGFPKTATADDGGEKWPDYALRNCACPSQPSLPPLDENDDASRECRRNGTPTQMDRTG